MITTAVFRRTCLIVSALVFATATTYTQSSGRSEHTVFDGRLAAGYDMGVATAGGATGWVTERDGYLRLTYPGHQAWGAVFVTFGKPRPNPRPGKDLSLFDSLFVEMRGLKGGEKVDIGIKDADDPDDGSEDKVTLVMTKQWRTYRLPLSQFMTANLRRVYVITEFVFGNEKVSVDVRSIRYVKR